MPFHTTSHSHPQQSQQNNNGQLLPESQVKNHSLAGGLIQAAQTLSSVASSATHSRSSSIAAANNTSFYNSSNVSTPLAGIGGYPSQSVGSSHQSGANSYTTTPSYTNADAYFEPQRPTGTYRRPSEELHLSSAHRRPSDMNNYQMMPSYGSGDSGAYLQQQTPSQQSQPSASGHIPGALQSGSSGRPGMNSMNSASGAAGGLPQLNTQMQEPTTPSRPQMSGHSHSYSRSSPAGLDQQKYKPYSNTGETPRIAPPQNFLAQSSNSSYSPLGLADIRPGTESGLPDGPLSPSPWGQAHADNLLPAPSKHVAPWPIYALDWCKWPVRHNGIDCGKIALGSYSEDKNNYVCDLHFPEGGFSTNEQSDTHSGRPEVTARS